VGKGAAPDGELNSSLFHGGAVSHGQTHAATRYSKRNSSVHAANVLKGVCRLAEEWQEEWKVFCRFAASTGLASLHASALASACMQYILAMC
jgi:hypothetical protein